MKSARLNLITAKKIGRADKVKCYGPSDFDSDFVEKHKDILSIKRGSGLWIWKPYIILKELEKMDYGDYLMYMDAGAFYIRSIKYLQKQMDADNTDIMLSSLLLPNKHWCKRDAFILMGVDSVAAAESHQAEATYLFLKKTNNSIAFIKEWLFYAGNKQIVDDSENILGKPNYEGFRENRHDQTILSLLAFKYGIEPYKGFSDSSEAYKFLALGEGAFFGYTKEDFIRMGLDEYNSNRYKKSKYPRIVVNARIRNQKSPVFEIEAIKCVYRTIRADIKNKKFKNEIFNSN